jgi:hypothetical protein
VVLLVVTAEDVVAKRAEEVSKWKRRVKKWKRRVKKWKRKGGKDSGIGALNFFCPLLSSLSHPLLHLLSHLLSSPSLLLSSPLHSSPLHSFHFAVIRMGILTLHK